MLTGSDDLNWQDRACAVLGLLAGLHCVLASLVSSSPRWLSGERAHLLFAVLSLAPSMVAVVRGWFIHHSSRVWAYAIPAWAAICVARSGAQIQMDEVSETVLTIFASLLLVVTHQLNRSLAYWHDRY